MASILTFARASSSLSSAISSTYFLSRVCDDNKRRHRERRVVWGVNDVVVIHGVWVLDLAYLEHL